LRRRDFLNAIGSVVAIWPTASWPQVTDARRIGVLFFPGSDNIVTEEGRQVFAKALADLGWKDGQNLRIDYRWAGSDIAKVAVLAKELVDLKPDVLLAWNTPAVRALQH
jgi:putative tryptophan/tyrosine transport system substrate-binding protein